MWVCRCLSLYLPLDWPVVVAWFLLGFFCLFLFSLSFFFFLGSRVYVTRHCLRWWSRRRQNIKFGIIAFGTLLLLLSLPSLCPPVMIRERFVRAALLSLPISSYRMVNQSSSSSLERHEVAFSFYQRFTCWTADRLA